VPRCGATSVSATAPNWCFGLKGWRAESTSRGSARDGCSSILAPAPSLWKTTATSSDHPIAQPDCARVWRDRSEPAVHGDYHPTEWYPAILRRYRFRGALLTSHQRLIPPHRYLTAPSDLAMRALPHRVLLTMGPATHVNNDAKFWGFCTTFSPAPRRRPASRTRPALRACGVHSLNASYVVCLRRCKTSVSRQEMRPCV